MIFARFFNDIGSVSGSIFDDLLILVRFYFQLIAFLKMLKLYWFFNSFRGFGRLDIHAFLCHFVFYASRFRIDFGSIVLSFKFF